MNAIKTYFANLSRAVGNGWNRFWFEPRDPSGVALLRVLTGILVLYYLGSHTSDLVVWFGPAGLLPAGVVRQPEFIGPTLFDGAPLPQASFHVSYLSWIRDPWVLRLVHWAGIAVALSFTLGLFTRVTNVLTAIVVLAYAHRAPMITGQLEPILTLLLLYLCLAPSGARLSLDRWWRGRSSQGDAPDEATSWTATLSQRLIQVHVAGLYLLMALSKLAGDTWWSGDAVWWLIAHTESRLIDLTFLHNAPLVLNAWTHLIVAFELVFPVLIWNRLARPLLLVGAVLMWVPLALITGLLAFGAAILVASLSFVSPDSLRRVVDRLEGMLPGGAGSRSMRPSASEAAPKPEKTSAKSKQPSHSRHASLDTAAVSAGKSAGG